MSSTVELAEAGRKPSVIQPPRTARQTREARIGFWRVVIVSSFFVVVLGANLFVGVVVMVRSIQAQANAEKTGANGHFAQIKRPLPDGTFCRNIVFDNKTATSIEDKIERCEQTASKPKGKSKSQFSWGG